MGILNTYIRTVSNTLSIQKLKNKSAKIAVMGLGKKGLSAALHLSSKYRVIGFDHNRDRVSLIQQQKDPAKLIATKQFENKDFFATSIANLLEVAQCFVLPASVSGLEDSGFKKNVFTVANFLKNGDVVILQSNQTMSSSFSKEVIAIIERISGLENGVDFNLAFVVLSNNSVVNLQSESLYSCDIEFHRLVNDIYDCDQCLTIIKSSEANTTKNKVESLVQQIDEFLRMQPRNTKSPSILLKGITSKKNSDKLSNSTAAAIYMALYRKGYAVEVQDNHVLPSQVMEKYGIELKTSTTKRYDLIVITVAHDNYQNATKEQWAKNCHAHTVILDAYDVKKSVALN